MQGNAPTAAAAVIAMIGDPIAHAYLPARFNAWAREQGADAMMTPLGVAPEFLEAFATLLRGWENCRGAVVTAPHKQAAAGLADDLSGRARLLGAANILFRRVDGALDGDNLDGAGFVAGLAETGRGAEGCRAVLLGCGGAGASIALALAEAGAREILLSDLDGGRAGALATTLSGLRLPGVTVAATATPEAAQWRAADLVINATPLGVDGVSAPVPVSVLDQCAPGALVADVIARPVLTPWLAGAKARGLAVMGGAAMAEGQFGLVLERLGFR